MTPLRSLRLCLVALPCLGAAACAANPALVANPTPEEIPALEARMAAAPDDIETGMRLAAAYRAEARFDEGAALVARLSDVDPENLGLMVMSGLIAEDRQAYGEARASYRAVLDADPGQALREQVEARLAIVRRAEFRAEVQSALAREAELTQTPPDPATVGVFPFVYEGADEQWQPLAVAIAELLATDLAITGRLQVVERLRIQALLTELALGESGRVDPENAARSGRLLGSANLVQGRLRVDPGDQVAVDAAVVEVTSPDAEEVGPVTAQDVMARFFDMEKQLAFDIHAELGIQLTPQERERINERQTESVEALLAFGRGLQAADAGDFQLAAQNFRQAEEIDPSFTLAQTELQEIEVVAAATAAAPAATTDAAAGDPETTPAQPEPEAPAGGDPAPEAPPPETAPLSVATATQQMAQQRTAVQQLQPPQTTAVSQVLQTLGQDDRSVIAEVTGTDRVGQLTLLQLILRPPPGDEQ